MKIFMNTNDLNAGLSIVSRAIGSRTTLPILEGVMAEADETGLLLRCTDLSMQIETRIPATVEEPGVIVLPGRIFFEMTKRLPGTDVDIRTENGAAYIESGRVKTTLQVMKAAEFPSMQEMVNARKVTLKQGLLRSMIKQTIFAIGSDDTKPVFSGVLMELKGDKIATVAMDGYRMAIREESLESEHEDISLVAPGKALGDIGSLLSAGSEECEVTFNKTHLKVDLGHTAIITRLVDLEYMKFDHIIPKTHETRVRVNRAELVSAIERASLMARESNSNIVKLSFLDNKLSIYGNSEVGRTFEEIEVEIMGKGIDIAFNARYLSDVFKALDDEEVYMDFIHNLSPAVIRPIGGDSYTYLVLPVRMF